MNGIGYIVDGRPLLTWPGPETTVEELVADLPEDTAYELVSEEDAEDWLAENQPATRLGKIQAIQAEYVPQLTMLQEAKAGAEMRDDAEGVTDIKAEYVSLLQEMNDKIQAVPND